MNTGRYITVQVAGRQCLVDRNKLVFTFINIYVQLQFFFSQKWGWRAVFYAAIFDWGNSLLRKLASGNNNSDRVGPEHFIFTACRPCIAVRMWL